MEASDMGNPIVLQNPEAHVSKIYNDIAKKVVDVLN